MTTIKLKKPINDGKISEITLKEPTFGMLQKHGLPFSSGGELNFKKAGPLLEACSGVQEPFLKEMAAKDAMRVIAAFAEMVADDEGNSD